MAKKRKIEHLQDAKEKGKRLEDILTNLSEDIKKVESRIPLTFDNFLYEVSERPNLVFRNIFQLFHDMAVEYIGEGVDEYESSDDSIGFVKYNCYKLFVSGCDEPFFADRLFANRFMNLIKGFKKGIQNNRIYLFEGPPGSGKSTFLNNLLHKFEEFTKTQNGITYKTFWRIDLDKVGGINTLNNNGINPEFNANIVNENESGKILEISCNCNDNPILQIPKKYRRTVLDEIITDKKFKDKLFNDKEYEWVFKDIPCSLCNSIYNTLMDKVGNPLDVYKMIYARATDYSRQFGKGLSVYNPGDSRKFQAITNSTIQNLLNSIFQTDNIKYVYSDLAFTNNGILALMDIKENNVERLKSLHGIISDGVHKVEFVEEHVKTLFVGLVNPEDKLHYENIKSFQDRITNVNIPYILDYNTEVAIYVNKFGVHIKRQFLPRVLENFAKIIISSRLESDCKSIEKWINSETYKKHIDKDLFLLKMDIYTGKIPGWINDEDIKKFTKDIRKSILQESENEGKKGFSGRQSIGIFNDFYLKFLQSGKIITMSDIIDFFNQKNEYYHKFIPEGFIESLEHLYDYNILQEVKESIYNFNEDLIRKEIANYLYASNFEIGDKIDNEYTGDKFELSDDLFKNFEAIYLGSTATAKQRKSFRTDVQNEYVRKTLAQEIKIKKLKINETEQFTVLYDKYIKNLKENALTPYISNENFRRAINDYNTPSFNTYDKKLKEDIMLLISNLRNKFGYTEDGAIQICLYVVDKNLINIY